MSRPSIYCSTAEIPLCQLMDRFEPREEKVENAKYKIPEYQRFFQWKLQQERDLVDSVMNGFPIPSIIVHKTVENSRETYWVEDGQQRLTALHRFVNNKFTYKYGDTDLYYPKEGVDASRCLTQEQLRYFDNRQIHVTIVEGDLTPEIKAEIFHRLQRGKPLSNGDKLMSRSSTKAVSIALQMMERFSDEDNAMFKSLDKKRKTLESAVGIVCGFVLGSSFITNSYERLYKFLDNEAFENSDKLKHLDEGIKFIKATYNTANLNNRAINYGNRCNLGKYLSKLIHTYNRLVDEYEGEELVKMKQESIEFWSKVIIISENNKKEVWDMISSRGARGQNITLKSIETYIKNIKTFMDMDNPTEWFESMDMEYVV